MGGILAIAGLFAALFVHWWKLARSQDALLQAAGMAGALLVMPDTETAVPPTFVTVTLFGALVVPTDWVPNVDVVAKLSWPVKVWRLMRRASACRRPNMRVN